MSNIKPWARTGTELLASCRIFDLRASRSVSPADGSAHEFYFIETPDWVNIIPVTEDGKVVCIRQFRHGDESITLEIPGGLVDPGESPAVAAIRECLEETGYEVAEAESLGELAPNPALFANRLYTYVAKNARPVAAINNTSTEHTEVVLVPIEEIEGYLLRGEIDHALVVATLWRWLFTLKREGAI